MPIGDATLGEVVRGEFERNPVARQHANAIAAKLAGQVREHFAFLIDFHTELSAGEFFNDSSRDSLRSGGGAVCGGCHFASERRLAAGAGPGRAGGVGALGTIAWRRAYVHRNRLEHIARFIETREPALGSRLINLLQLTGLAENPELPPLTRQLAKQAVEDYAAGLRNVPVENLARTGELRQHGQRAALALLIFCVLLGATYRISQVELARFFDPLGDHPPYSFTHLAITQPGPQGTNVLYDYNRFP